MDGLDHGSVERKPTIPPHYIEQVDYPHVTSGIVHADVVTPLYAGKPIRRPNPRPDAPPPKEQAL